MNNSEFIQWLLQAKTPSIRYFTLRHLLGRPDGDSEVEAERLIMNTDGPIPGILSGQTNADRWSGERSYYTPKYTSTHWSMLLLTELGVRRQRSPHDRKGAAFMLACDPRRAQCRPWKKGGLGLSCFWGNLLRCARALRSSRSARRSRISSNTWQTTAQNDWCCPYNGGSALRLGCCPCLVGDWQRCRPANDRPPGIEAAYTRVAYPSYWKSIAWPRQITRHRVKVHPLWFRLNFPLFLPGRHFICFAGCD
jgi:hypothetical protein